MGNDGDIDTVDTAGSDDGHSDIDDVPDIAPSEKAKLDEVKPVVPLGDKLRAFFSGRMYKHMSAIFGTMVCFFLVGMRVETLLHATGAIGDPGNTWEVTPGEAFWLETAWLCMFILISSLVVFIFRPVPVRDYERLKFFIVGMLDVALSSLCLVLLMVSEAITLIIFVLLSQFR